MTASPQFDRLADLYSRASMSDIENTRLIQGSVPAGLNRGLDIGCGTGRYSELLADRCVSVLSVDVSQRMVDIALESHARTNISYRVRGLFDITSERDGTFDAILAMFVLHMLPSHEVALKHLTELLAPGGHLILMDKVARPSGVSRPYLYYVAVRDSLYLAARRRVLLLALRDLRTRAHPSWIAHQFAFPGLPRAELHTRYAELLPGAAIVDHRHACAVHWQAPAI